MEKRFGPTGQVIFYSMYDQSLTINAIFEGTPLIMGLKIPSNKWNQLCDKVCSHDIDVNGESCKQKIEEHITYLNKNNLLGNILENGILCSFSELMLFDLLYNILMVIYFGIVPNDEMNGFIIGDDSGKIYGSDESNFLAEVGINSTMAEKLEKIDFILENPYICYKCKKRPECSLIMMCACKKVPYCGKDCQKADWKNHKKICPFSKKNI